MKSVAIILIGSILAFYTACAQGTLEDRIAQRAEKCSRDKPCTVSISSLTPFQWDKMYVFKYNATLEEIKNALGFFLPEKKQFTRKIVFVHNGQMVFNEEWSTNVEHVENGEVVFDIPDENVYREYSAKEDTFHIETVNSDGGRHYALKQVRPNK